MSKIDEILRRGRHEPKTVEASGYAAFAESGGYPQMGFSLHQADGRMHGFFYHSIDNLDLRIAGGVQYLNFTHRGKAVTLQGTGLDAIFNALMGHVLTGIFEFREGQQPPADPKASLVTRTAVTMVSLSSEMMASHADEVAAEMRQH